MDAKKRVSVPAPWLDAEEVEFHVVPHPKDGFLMVMPREEFERWEQRFLGSAANATEKRRAVRMFYSQAYTVVTDKQGRILLPDTHCEKAGLQSEIVFIGGGSRFEIWSKERHEQMVADDAGVFEQLAGEIGL